MPKKYSMKYGTILTVSQSKRLIARGVTYHPMIKKTFNGGTIGICKGTTTSYITEELGGNKLESFTYTNGLSLPKKPYPDIPPGKIKHDDYIICKGKIFMDKKTIIE